MKKTKIFVLVICHLLIVGGLLMGGLTFYNNYTDLQKEYENLKQEHIAYDQVLNDYQQLAQKFQENQTGLLIIKDWCAADGYEDPQAWMADFQKYKEQYADCDIKVIEGDNKEYISDEQKQRLSEINSAIKSSRSVNQIKELAKEFDLICEDIEKHKNEVLYNESQVTTDAYS